MHAFDVGDLVILQYAENHPQYNGFFGVVKGVVPDELDYWVTVLTDEPRSYLCWEHQLRRPDFGEDLHCTDEAVEEA